LKTYLLIIIILFSIQCERGWLRKLTDPNYNGCTDTTACNYNNSSYKDDGSCAFISDCDGVCGGYAIEDDCGVCNGDSSTCETDSCLGVNCLSYCNGNTAYYNGYCSNGNCNYTSQYCSSGCSNGECNPENSNVDCSNAYYCSDCSGCELSCCPNYCSGNYYYYNRSCSGGFCVGATSEFCPNGCNSNGCN